MTSPALPIRRVRPGEVPAFGSVWCWTRGRTDFPRLALGLSRINDRHYLLCLNLWEGRLTRELCWADQAFVGMGPVLTDWWCLDEG